MDNDKDRIAEINKYIREINDAYYKDDYSGYATVDGYAPMTSQGHLFEYIVVCYYDAATEETVETTYFTQDSATHKMKELLQDGICAWIRQEK